MAAITAPLLAKVPQLRPLNIVRDLPGVANLVEKCFADTLDAEGRNYIQQMRRAGQDNSFLRWANRAVETASMPLSGYVWEEDGEIIGNVSLIPYRHAHKKYYLIANVAVRPEYRKRGIGRALTAAAMQLAKQRHADETWLHVRDDNLGAIELYRSMGFVELARRTTWQIQADRNAGAGSTGILVTRRVARDWPTQETWLLHLYPHLLAWYQPMPWNSLRPGIGPALYRFMSDDVVRHWVARIPFESLDHPSGTISTRARTHGLPCAMVSWQAMAERSNRLWVAVPPEGNGEILSELLMHARHQFFWREKTNLDFPAGLYSAAIEAAGFHPNRTLLWMKSDETSADEMRKSL
jgi:ribosomal protein S18 acetylase RimI-like enzyme